MNKSLPLIALLTALASASSTHAGYTPISGIDNGGPEVQVTPTNSLVAENQFKAQLSSLGTEDFESLAIGTVAPLTLDFGTVGMATLSGGGDVWSNPPGGTDGAGRYSVPGGTRFWRVQAGGGATFQIDFSTPIAGFGFYGVDIGDFDGTVQIDVLRSGTLLTTLGVPSASRVLANASILYFGIIADDAADEFNQVRFKTTTGIGDVFAFDSMTIGTRQVPTPATLALVGLGLIGLGLSRRRA